MSELGAGIALQEDWDFEVGRTGDLVANTGINELEKDIAFFVGIEMEPLLGARVDPNTRKEIESRINRVMTRDPRIDGISSLRIEEDTVNRNTYEVTSTVETAEGPFELVFEVSL